MQRRDPVGDGHSGELDGSARHQGRQFGDFGVAQANRGRQLFAHRLPSPDQLISACAHHRIERTLDASVGVEPDDPPVACIVQQGGISRPHGRAEPVGQAQPEAIVVPHVSVSRVVGQSQAVGADDGLETHCRGECVVPGPE
ncbi:hypothetical protein [Nocardia sp. NPDC004604]|uniref:hypothetical protein n=1 Tax=Nocardia sp. NPDC004604 TaxID=3157013 RepID=UPI0033B3C604